MPYSKKASDKYFALHREEWNEYTRNYSRNKYQNDPVFREKEKARKNLANKIKRESQQQLLLIEKQMEPVVEPSI
jgi:hypothetical protein